MLEEAQVEIGDKAKPVVFAWRTRDQLRKDWQARSLWMKRKTFVGRGLFDAPSMTVLVP
jgi:hypothetical protein